MLIQMSKHKVLEWLEDCSERVEYEHSVVERKIKRCIELRQDNTLTNHRLLCLKTDQRRLDKMKSLCTRTAAFVVLSEEDVDFLDQIQKDYE